jgi:hypothetical protein
MKRRLEPIDLMVAVGVCATIICGYLMFLSANGQVNGAAVHQQGMAEMTDAMSMVQPALGQAIVEDALLQQAASRDISHAAMQLSQAIIASQGFDLGSADRVDDIVAQAGRAEAEHLARVQYVLGRSIVGFTARGIRSGALSGREASSDFNRRMIEMTQAAGARMDEQFQETHQTNLGRDLMLAGQDRMRLAERIQQHLGRTIVAITTVQDRYQQGFEGLQEQLAATAIAAIKTQDSAALFARLAEPDFSGGSASMTVAETRSLPDLPMGLLLALCGALVGVFLLGLFMPAARREAEPRIEVQEITLEHRVGEYRKAG